MRKLPQTPWKTDVAAIVPLAASFMPDITHTCAPHTHACTSHTRASKVILYRPAPHIWACISYMGVHLTHRRALQICMGAACSYLRTYHLGLTHIGVHLTHAYI